MSTSWHIRCVTCGETNHFDESDHASETMRVLCDHAPAIAAIAPLVESSPVEIRLDTPHGEVDVAWFSRHAGHALVPIDEYGRLITQCDEYAKTTDGHDRDMSRDPPCADRAQLLI